jgi:hypothetical protein
MGFGRVGEGQVHPDSEGPRGAGRQRHRVLPSPAADVPRHPSGRNPQSHRDVLLEPGEELLAPGTIEVGDSRSP